MSRPSSDPEAPKPDKADVGYALVKAAISGVPVVGGPAAELFGLAIRPPLERRMVDWANRIGERIRVLEEKLDGFRLENLKDNPLFTTIVMHATSLALRNHQEEKLEALENAVVNTAGGIDIEENFQLLFLNLIDGMTPIHLAVLKYLDDPRGWLGKHGIALPSIMYGGVSAGLETAFPQLKSQREFYDTIATDLHNQGLLTIDRTGLHIMTSESTIFSSHTSQLGKKFLTYMTSH